MKKNRKVNDGLTVRLNFWSLKTYKDDLNTQDARHHIKGEATNLGTRESKFFRDAGALLTILSGWNADQLSKFKKKIKSGGDIK